NVASAVPGLLPLLRSAPPHGRAGAAQALADIGEPARPVLSELFDALATEPEPKVRRQIIQAAYRMLHRAERERWTGPLSQALRAPDVEVRASLAWMLGAVGPVPAPLARDLVDSLRFEHEPLRRHALQALAQIGPAAGAELPAVLALVRSPSIGVQL